jgi:hypothetical protein
MVYFLYEPGDDRRAMNKELMPHEVDIFYLY